MSNPWNQWLDGLPADQKTALIESLYSRGEIQRSAHADEKHIPIICTPASELLVNQTVPFVDVFGLMPQYQALAFQDHGNLLLKGPKGNGKSLSIRAAAFAWRIPLVVVECSENTKDLQLIGRYVLVGRETKFVLSGLPKAIRIANEVGRCILLFEEFNALTPQSQKMLNGVLQERAVEVDSLGQTFRLNQGCTVWFTGTMNPSVYGGTYDLNEDLKSRMSEIETGYPPTEYEKQIIRANLGQMDAAMEDITDLMLRFAKESRQKAIGYALSTRDIVRTLQTVRTNGLKPALQMLVCKYEGEERKTALARVGSIFKGATVTEFWDGK